MRVEVNLDCPVDYVYKRIIDTVVLDIKRYSNNRPQRDYLEGFTYEKTCSDGSKAKIIISKQEKNKVYEFKTETIQRDYISCYGFQDIEKDKCKVIFTEKMISKSFLQKINDSLMQFLFGHGRKKQFLQMLEQIARDYQLET